MSRTFKKNQKQNGNAARWNEERHVKQDRSFNQVYRADEDRMMKDQLRDISASYNQRYFYQR
jgi:hypothetical protein